MKYISLANLAAAALALSGSRRGLLKFAIRSAMGLILAAVIVTPAVARETRSLAGSWRFRLDAQNTGLSEKWYAAPLVGDTTIKLPGTMDDAGLGPKNTKSPTLAGPYRLYDYAGLAWYQRDIEIPSGWSAKRVTLFLERCRWVTSVWLDDRLIGTRDSLIAPHEYDFGTHLTPGFHRLTISVDNTVKLDLGPFVSALFGGTPGNMNGIIGRIELAATPPVWIDTVQVYPDVSKKLARVVVSIGNATGAAGSGTLRVGAQRVEATWDAKGGRAEVEVDMSGAKLWDEFSPVLQQLKVKLGEDSRTVSFGMRQFVAKGTQFTMNGRPLFLRGTLECSIWPLTGYPPTDVAAWQRVYRIMKSYGLNYIRFHSWCPPEAAFAAADIEGIMIQAEGPQANVQAGENPKRDAFVEAEFQRIIDIYGNHPSFCTMTIGNEYGGDGKVLTRWVDSLIQRDPRHLYSSASAAQTTTNRQFTEACFDRGIHGPGTARDMSNSFVNEGRPPLGHEIGQWMFFPDFNEMKKYTGVLRLKNFEMIRSDLEKKQMLDLAPQFQQACGKQAVALYKEEIELLRRTPNFGGFSLLDLHDYPTQGTALIGPLDEFWDSKGFITPAAYRRFCGPTVPLLRIPKRTYTVGESFAATVDISHFGPADLVKAQPVWRITEAGKEVASGKLPVMTVPTGKLTSLGAFTASLAKATAPGKLTVTVSVNDFSNDWEIWVYPSARAEIPGDVVIGRTWDEGIKTALAQGKRVILFPDNNTTTMKSLPGSFLPVFWSPVWFPQQVPNANGILCDPKHPLFAQFPTEPYANWQWWEMLNNSRTLILDDLPGFRPIVQVIDNFERNHKLGNLFEAQVGGGKLLVCTMNLPQIAATHPEANQFLKSLYAYAASSSFQPKQTLELSVLNGMFRPKLPNTLKMLGATIHADSEAPGHEAALAIDDKPDTFWHTQWQPTAAPMPHTLDLELGRAVTMTGITCLPRQDQPNGRVGEVAVFADGNQVVTTQWPNTSELQTLRFPQPVTARTLRLVIKSEVNGNSFAGIAELDVLTR